MPRLSTILSANYIGAHYAGYEHSQGHLIIARRADRRTKFVRAKDAAHFIDRITDDIMRYGGEEVDALLSVAPGSFEDEANRVVSDDLRCVACYA